MDVLRLGLVHRGRWGGRAVLMSVRQFHSGLVDDCEIVGHHLKCLFSVNT